MYRFNVKDEFKTIRVERVFMSGLGNVYECKECGAIFVSENDVLRHIEYHKHGYKERKPYKPPRPH